MLSGVPCGVNGFGWSIPMVFSILIKTIFATRHGLCT